MTTVIAPSHFLQGSLHASTIVRIQGRVEGNLFSDEGIYVEPSGFAKGEIHAKEVVIQGRFEGRIVADHVMICLGGRCFGEIESHTLKIESKGHFEGRRRIIEPQWEKPEKTRKPIEPFDTEAVLL